MAQCDLRCRHVGLLVVHVMDGRDLNKMDAFGKADPFLELYTQPTDIEKTVRLTCSFSRGDFWERLPTKVPVTGVQVVFPCSCIIFWSVTQPLSCLAWPDFV